MAILLGQVCVEIGSNMNTRGHIAKLEKIKNHIVKGNGFNAHSLDFNPTFAIAHDRAASSIKIWPIGEIDEDTPSSASILRPIIEIISPTTTLNLIRSRKYTAARMAVNEGIV